MSEQDLAIRIKDTTRHLNAIIKDAANSGLRVEMMVMEKISNFGLPNPPSLEVKVLREL